MSVEDLKSLYEAIDPDNDLMPFYLFAEMVGDETNVQTILSWFKHTAVQH